MADEKNQPEGKFAEVTRKSQEARAKKPQQRIHDPYPVSADRDVPLPPIDQPDKASGE